MHGQSPRKHVLVVEDEHDVAQLIKHALERTREFDATIVAAGDSALKAAADAVPDLIVLDLNLPVLDGMDVFRILRSRPDTSRIPVIILTARASEVDRVAGLELGADDYVTKPFSPRELVARVRVVLRRSQSPTEAAPLVYRGKHLSADFDAISVHVDGEPIRLTRREYDLLRYLVTNQNRVISRDRLLERVWGYERVVETRSVDVHVGRLRAKLRAAGRQIETVVGLGYRFIE
jgi:DNA-binding response OmpR family regulator